MKVLHKASTLALAIASLAASTSAFAISSDIGHPIPGLVEGTNSDSGKGSVEEIGPGGLPTPIDTTTDPEGRETKGTIGLVCVSLDGQTHRWDVGAADGYKGFRDCVDSVMSAWTQADSNPNASPEKKQSLLRRLESWFRFRQLMNRMDGACR